MKRENNTGLLKCKVGGGMFEGERIISFIINGSTVSAIVNKENIKNKEWLEVDIYKERGKELLIGIPGETFSTTRKIWVSQERIK